MGGIGFRYDPRVGGVRGSSPPSVEIRRGVGIGSSSASGYGSSGTSSSGLYTKVGGSKPLGGGGTGGSGAGTGGGATVNLPSLQMPTLPTTPDINQPQRPNLPPIDPTGQERPEHERLRSRYEEFGQDIKEGTGFAMDVLEGQQQDRMEAQVEQAREQAAALGIPFDEKAYRAELQRGVNAAMAQEKLGREGLYQTHLANIAPITAGAEYAQGEKGIDLQRDVAEQEGLLQRYGIDVSKYGTDVQAAARASEMLMDFYKTLMSGLMSGPSMSYSGGNVSFG